MDRKKILVVDDDQDLLKLLKVRIEGEGYEFMSAGDGEEMLKLLNAQKPDLVMLDIMMPKMDGYTALREMRNQDNFKDIPVIILTAKDKHKMEDLFKLEDVRFFVEKPFDTKDLLEKIKSSLQ